MAEAFYNHLSGTNDAYSAGTDPETPRKYPQLPSDVCQLMAEEGIDVGHKKVKTIDELFVEEADQIFVMCTQDQCPPFLKESDKVTYWPIQDPYKMKIEGMRQVRDEIKARVKSII